MRNAIRRALLLSPLCIVAGTPASALANATSAPSSHSHASVSDTEKNQGLKEIIVTAQRRKQNIQQVPIAVTAISPRALQQAGITSALGVASLVPGMFAANNTGLGTANVYSIRGQNNTESIATFDAPVGTYVDDIYVARQNANNYSLFDIARIEVLRGPQGTLFGRNTTGGAVSIHLRKPSPTPGGFAEIGYGSFDQRTFRGSINVPVSSKFLTKVDAFYVKDNGFVHDMTTNQTLNGNDARGVRAAIRWLPTDALTWDLEADYIDQSYMNLLNYPNAQGDRIANVGMNTVYSVYPTLFSGPKSKYPLENQVLEHSVTSNVTWRTRLGTVNFITGWRDLEQKFFIDFFDSPLPAQQVAGANGGEFLIDNEGRATQFTQEIKLDGAALHDRLKYVTGLYFFDEMDRTNLGQAFVLPGGLLPPGLCLPNSLPVCDVPTNVPGQYETAYLPFFYDRTLYNTTRSYAIYGQGDYRLTHKLTVTLGARYTDEIKTIEYTPNPNPYAPAVNQFSTADMIAAGIPTRQESRQLTPRIAFRWDFTSEINAYVSATRGFSGGGWNARSSTASLLLPFRPETTWSYETGLRSQWFHNRLRANVTGFYSETRNYQLPSAYVPPGGGGDVFITGNFAGLTVHGIEGEFTAQPTRDLNVFANLDWQQGRYQYLSSSVRSQQARCQAELASGTSPVDCGQGIVDSAGTIAEPVRLPRHDFTVGASYTFHLGFADLTPNAMVNDVGQYEVDTAQAQPNSRSHGYDSLEVGISLVGANDFDSHWSVTANCTNCTNKLILATKLPPTLYYQDPRRWQVELRYDY